MKNYKNCITLILSVLSIIMLSAQNEQLEIEGAIQIANSSADPDPGTIRWTGSDFEGWNGFKWVSLTTGSAFNYGSVSDIDGNRYHTVTVGSYEWMAENLRTTRYNDGTYINNLIEQHQWNYKNQSVYGEVYGKLYDHHAVSYTGGILGASRLCPQGWRVPGTDEWNDLRDRAGGLDHAGGILKEIGLSHWVSPNDGATDSLGFRALPGGGRFASDQSYRYNGLYGYWWTSEKGLLPSLGKFYKMEYSTTQFLRQENPIENAYSVRCVRDAIP